MSNRRRARRGSFGSLGDPYGFGRLGTRAVAPNEAPPGFNQQTHDFAQMDRLPSQITLAGNAALQAGQGLFVGTTDGSAIEPFSRTGTAMTVVCTIDAGVWQSSYTGRVFQIGDGTLNNRITLCANGSGRARLFVDNATTRVVDFSASSQITGRTDFAVTCNGTSYQIFVNNNLDGSSTGTGTIPNTTQIGYGCEPTVPQLQLDGLVIDLQIWDRLLDPPPSGFDSGFDGGFGG